MPFPREFLLVAACCRWPLSADAIAAIGELADGGIDWRYLLRIVKRQRVPALVHHALAAAKIELPSDIAREWELLARRIARRNMILARESIRLQSAFDAADIRAIGLKGVALGQLAYGSLALKHSRDIDILVGPDQALPALRLLEHDGYALRLPAKHLSEAQRRAMVCYDREAELTKGKLRVELHWRLVDNPLLLKGVDASSPTETISLPVAGAIRTLAEGDLFAFLCVHGAYHRWSRLKWLADVNALIAAKGDAEIARLYRYATDRGAGLCAGQALLLCQRLLALRLPADLTGELHASRRLAKLVAIALHEMAGADATTQLGRGAIETARNQLGQFLLGEGPAFFIAECWKLSVGKADAILLPLPAGLHFLYPILRLPLWLWRRVNWAAAAPAVNQTKSTLNGL